VVGSVEYRFPLWDYLSSRAGLDAFFFVDGGQVWGETDWSWNRLRYSLGGGFRVGHESRQVLQTTFGWSPEGYQLNLGVETEL
jgi:outer membrane protein assembly factor BamA